MAEFRLTNDEATFLLEEIDCGPPPSILSDSTTTNKSRSNSCSNTTTTSPTDGLNFEDFDFDWYNDSIDDLPLIQDSTTNNNHHHALELGNVRQVGHVASLSGQSVGHSSSSSSSDGRPVLVPRGNSMEYCPYNNGSNKGLIESYDNNKNNSIDPVPLTDIRQNGSMRTNTTEKHVPVLPPNNVVSSTDDYSLLGRDTPNSECGSSSTVKTAFRTKTSATVTTAPVNVLPATSSIHTKFHVGSSLNSVSNSNNIASDKAVPVAFPSEEAKRRRAIRKGIILKQKNHKKGVSTSTAMPTATQDASNPTAVFISSSNSPSRPSSSSSSSSSSAATSVSSRPPSSSLSSSNETTTIMSEVSDIAQKLLNDSTLFGTSTTSNNSTITGNNNAYPTPVMSTYSSNGRIGQPPPPQQQQQSSQMMRNMSSPKSVFAVPANVSSKNPSSTAPSGSLLTPIPEEGKTKNSGAFPGHSNANTTSNASFVINSKKPSGVVSHKSSIPKAKAEPFSKNGGNATSISTISVCTDGSSSLGGAQAGSTSSLSTEMINSSNIDLTMEDFASELPQGNDPESRKQRRLIRNRLSAALHRKRKRETIDTQKRIIDEKDNEIASLKQQLQRVTSNYNEIKADFDALVNHFGYREIKNILAEASPPPSAPPSEIVGGSSDHSVDSSLDSPSGGGCSPMHTSPAYDDHQHHRVSNYGMTANIVSPRLQHSSSSPVGSSSHLPASGAAFAGRNSHHHNSNNNKKKRITAKSLPAMATMAMCAVLGCVVLPPSIFKVLDPDGSGLQTANVIISSDIGSDARRRLDEAVSPDEMSAMAKWSSELSVSKLITTDSSTSNRNKNKSSNSYASLLESSSTSTSSGEASKSTTTFVISPIESQPKLWRLDSTTGSPWTVDRSITLFDVRAAIVASTRVPPSVVSNNQFSAVVPYQTSYPLSRGELVLPKTGAKIETSKAIVATGNLRGFTNKRLPWTENDHDMDEEPNMTNGSLSIEDDTTSIDIVRDATTIPESTTTTGGPSPSTTATNGSKLGPNFMFCPSAYASFAPGFLQLAGLSAQDGDAQLSNEGNHWKWSGQNSRSTTDSSSDLYKSKDEIKSDMIVDFDDDDDDTGSVVDVGEDQFEDSLTMTTDHDVVHDDKALVPSYQFLTKPSAAFPFAARGSDGERVPLLKNVFTSGTNGDPYMSILVPASTLSTNLSLWGATSKDNDDEEATAAPTPAWVELGCQVLSAKYVDGVHFVGGGGDHHGSDSFASPLH